MLSSIKNGQKYDQFSRIVMVKPEGFRNANRRAPQVLGGAGKEMAWDM
jgi:hypothetical protein